MKKIFFTGCLFLATATFAQTAKTVVTDKMPGAACDNIVHNTLPADAPDRSPSECEIQFDWKVRTALRDAFKKALQQYSANDWVISDTAVEPLKEVSKATERIYFALSYYFKIDMLAQSDLYRSQSEKYNAAMEAVSAQPGATSSNKLSDVLQEVNEATHIKFYITVNDLTKRIYFIKGGHRLFNQPGASFAVRGPYAAGLSGGGIDNARNACLLVFGKSNISSQKENDGGTSFLITNSFAKASKLTVQNIAIRMEGSDALIDALLKEIDLKQIEALVGH